MCDLTAEELAERRARAKAKRDALTPEELARDRAQQRLRYWRNVEARRQRNAELMRLRREQVRQERGTVLRRRIRERLRQQSRWKEPRGGWGRRAEIEGLYTSAAEAYEAWFEHLDRVTSSQIREG